LDNSTSHAFAGLNVGVTQVGDRIWVVTFVQYGLGYFDNETCGLESIELRSARKCYLCARNELLPMCPEWTLLSWLAALDDSATG
jgi:hypothetical protein